MKGNEPNIDKALEREWKSTDSRKNETIKLKCVTEEEEAAQMPIEEVIEQTQYTNSLNLGYTNFTQLFIKQVLSKTTHIWILDIDKYPCFDSVVKS